MSAAEQTYRYPSSSSLDEGRALSLSTFTPNALVENPYFFEGALEQPRLAAELLCAVHVLVGSRFFIPANTLRKILEAADPVVTSGGGVLRFEGFSMCSSAYVRVDMAPEFYDGEVVGRGTTNVDFNAPMRAALARVRDTNGLSLRVGRAEVVVRTAETDVVEKKVPLPLRWLRGMLETQAYQASMTRRFEVSGLEALRFMRALPRASTSKTPLFVSVGPFGLRTTTSPESGAVRLVEAKRLAILEPLLPKARSLSAYTDEAQQAVAWVLELDGARLTLLLSAEVWRGFSGEGQALRALMNPPDARSLALVRAQLNWQALLDAPSLASTLGISHADAAGALCVLGASGLVGFDLARGGYFHRVLPLDLTAIEEMNPRLVSARALVADGSVQFERSTPIEARVRGSEAVHHVREMHGELTCTCPWYAKHKGARGPCKHALAVEYVAADRECVTS